MSSQRQIKRFSRSIVRKRQINVVVYAAALVLLLVGDCDLAVCDLQLRKRKRLAGAGLVRLRFIGRRLSRTGLGRRRWLVLARLTRSVACRWLSLQAGKIPNTLRVPYEFDFGIYQLTRVHLEVMPH